MDQSAEIERLQRENMALRRELAGTKKKSGISLGCIIGLAVGLVGLLLMVPPIMAAVALPMYSTFKQKTKIGTAIKSLSGAQQGLMAWHDETRSFDGITIAPDGGAFTSGDLRVGAGLPQIPGLIWKTETSKDTMIVSFEWLDSGGCPPSVCNGIWRIDCDSEDDMCRVSCVVGEDGSDPLGMSF